MRNFTFNVISCRRSKDRSKLVTALLIALFIGSIATSLAEKVTVSGGIEEHQGWRPQAEQAPLPVHLRSAHTLHPKFIDFATGAEAKKSPRRTNSYPLASRKPNLFTINFKINFSIIIALLLRHHHVPSQISPVEKISWRSNSRRHRFRDHFPGHAPSSHVPQMGSPMFSEGSSHRVT